MSARRIGRRWRADKGLGPAVEAPPVFWGRIGDYEAVTRRGILLLLSPEPGHPSLRVKNGP